MDSMFETKRRARLGASAVGMESNTEQLRLQGWRCSAAAAAAAAIL
jgi:hypothetical protein